MMSRWRSPSVPQALGIVGLFNLAVAHPVYQVLGGSPEFFVARRTAPADVWLLVGLLSVILPAGLVGLARITGRITQRARDVAPALLVGLLAAVLTLQMLEHIGFSDVIPAISGAFLAGLAATTAYLRTEGGRMFVVLLGPAVLLVPLLFLVEPTVRVFALPREMPPSDRPAAPLKATPPIVLIVFDQLPLSSLLDAEGEIDRRLYPAFAGLAANATWFRNATAVSESTGWALPPIVTGKNPQPAVPATAAAHPNTLFTFFSGAYRMNVSEPITRLCAQSICPPVRDSPGARLVAIALDIAIVYLHVVSPREMEASLPPVSQSWKNFAADRDWHRRWVQSGDADRRVEPERFIDRIRNDTSQPTLHFLHVLLPHEPYIYAPSGQAVGSGTALPGLGPEGTWSDDEWLVTQTYQSHLLQLGYVDALLGRIIDRLKAVELYDRALIVVTSDHGASFVPGHPFKAVTERTAADILAVPLLVKRPGQRDGEVSDRNVEAVDITPTIADIVGTSLPWHVDGVSAIDPAVPPRPGKTAFVNGARQVVRRGPVVFEDVRATATRKLALFRSGDPRSPLRAPYGHLVGRDIKELRVGPRWEQRVVLEDAHAFDSVDPEADFVPARLIGGVYGAAEEKAPLALAVAVNNRIRALTFTGVGSDAWSAFVPLEAFRRGRNDVQIFVVREGQQGPVLRAGFEARRPPDLNLISGEAKHVWGVQQSGLFGREWMDSRPFHWTDGAARLTTSIDPDNPPTAIRIALATTGRQAKLRLLVNGCEVFHGEISGAWSETLRLDSCPIQEDQASIELLSDTSSPTPQESRRLGVGLESVTLLVGTSED